jgi:N-acyl-D-amino-acid deacylase
MIRVRFVTSILIAGLALAAILGVGASWWWKHRPRFDMLIYNARVFDGKRFRHRYTVVAVNKGRIAAVGLAAAGPARRYINARGLVLAPGFIDVHTHIEGNVPAHRPLHAWNFVLQGVTTVITGNCGTSAVDIGAFLKGIDRNHSDVNVATLVGHNSIREAVMGNSAARADDAQLSRMRALVVRAMDAGALGFSTGLAYAPGVFADEAEVIALAAEAGKRGGLYVTHLRDEAAGEEAALAEAVRIATAAKTPLHVSHFKIASHKDWGKAAQRLEQLASARPGGRRPTLDVYAYSASSTTTDILLPPPMRGGHVAWKEVASDPARRRELFAGMTRVLQTNGFEDYGYANIAYFHRDHTVEGKSIPQLADLLAVRDRSEDSAGRRRAPDLDRQKEAVYWLLRQGGAQMVYHDMSERDVETILRDPAVSFGTDSAVRSSQSTSAHPRGIGNFPRVLGHYVRGTGTLSLADALHKMTGLAASTFGLSGRGCLNEGCAADMVIFDPAQIQDKATYADPLRPPSGIKMVFVNGVLTVDDGNETGAQAGQAIRALKR